MTREIPIGIIFLYLYNIISQAKIINWSNGREKGKLREPVPVLYLKVKNVQLLKMDGNALYSLRACTSKVKLSKYKIS